MPLSENSAYSISYLQLEAVKQVSTEQNRHDMRDPVQERNKKNKKKRKMIHLMICVRIKQ